MKELVNKIKDKLKLWIEEVTQTESNGRDFSICGMCKNNK